MMQESRSWLTPLLSIFQKARPFALLALVIPGIVVAVRWDWRMAQCLPAHQDGEAAAFALVPEPHVWGLSPVLTDLSTGATIGLGHGYAIEAQPDGVTFLVGDRDIYVWRDGARCLDPLRHSQLPPNESYNILSGGFGGVGSEYQYEDGRLTITVYDTMRMADPENPGDGFSVLGSRTLEIP